jgi:hypothetical protein
LSITNSPETNKNYKTKKYSKIPKWWWLMPIILATWEAQISRTEVGGQTGQTVPKTPSPKNNQSKMDWRYGSSCRASVLKAEALRRKRRRRRRRKIQPDKAAREK